MLYITEKITGYYRKGFRRLLASILGGTWALISFLLCEVFNKNQVVVTLITYTLITFTMVIIDFGFGNIKRFIVITVTLFLTTFAMGGMCYAIYYNSNVGYVMNVKAVPVSGIVMSGMLMLLAKEVLSGLIRVREKYNGNIYKVIIEKEKKKVELIGLIDTGNVLTDPYTGKEVHIVRQEAVKVWLQSITDSLNYRLVPYNSVGTNSGIIPVIDVDVMKIYDCNRIIFENAAAIGIYNGKLSKTDRYDLLINSAVLKNKE